MNMIVPFSAVDSMKKGSAAFSFGGYMLALKIVTSSMICMAILVLLAISPSYRGNKTAQGISLYAFVTFALSLVCIWVG